MKTKPKNIKRKMNVIGGGLSSDVINKAMKMVDEIESTPDEGSSETKKFITNIEVKRRKGKQAFDKISFYQGEVKIPTAVKNLVSKVENKMKTAGFIPAFLDGGFSSEFVDFKITYDNPAFSKIEVSVSNKKYNMGFEILLTGSLELKNPTDISAGANWKRYYASYDSRYYSNITPAFKEENSEVVSEIDLGKVMNKLEKIYKWIKSLFHKY